MNVQTRIEEKLLALEPVSLVVENESGNHSVAPGSETHFKVAIVSASFEGKRLLERHRTVNRLLADELAGPVHALAIHAYTEAEWEQRGGQERDSPACLGGSNSD